MTAVTTEQPGDRNEGWEEEQAGDRVEDPGDRDQRRPSASGWTRARPKAMTNPIATEIAVR